MEKIAILAITKNGIKIAKELKENSLPGKYLRPINSLMVIRALIGMAIIHRQKL